VTGFSNAVSRALGVNYGAQASTPLAAVLDSASGLVSADLCLSVVQRVFEKHPTIVKQLAFATDAFGRVALNITHGAVRDFIQSRIFFCGRYELQEGPNTEVAQDLLTFAELEWDQLRDQARRELAGGPTVEERLDAIQELGTCERAAKVAALQASLREGLLGDGGNRPASLQLNNANPTRPRPASRPAKVHPQP
jgi:hypothetical protein